jgi:hypothetical protein
MRVAHAVPGKVIGLGFWRYDITTAEMESMKLLII